MALVSEITDLSMEEGNFDERLYQINAGIRRARDSDDSDESTGGFSDFDSEASRVNYWKEIGKEEKDNGINMNRMVQ